MSTAQAPLNPLTALVIGASGWVLVLGLNSPAASLAIIAIALIAGTWRTRNPSLTAATAVLAAPVAVSMLLIHAPYGEHRIAPLLTSDGLADAAHLSARFTALIACLLAAVAWIRTPDLAKALQAAPGGNRLGYIAGTTLQLGPQGAQRIRAVRDANRLKQRPITLKTVVPNLVMPVLTELLTQAGARGQALETAGYDLTGHRTVLRPVHDSTAQRVARILVPLACVAVVVWI
ncbi:energy-coupling factor transporter transmembrane component T [uncultured Corynebacterium sp.]|uniref:energy-coupling factor transporter transmembrane component T n=1 Tax=uncultured Corynebacterium sp. TaxID=159447 RepID=UPI00259B16FF|nr:energy-coupling factor transporter transmembrane component T [uncultured Corynebacterium sp.]